MNCPKCGSKNVVDLGSKGECGDLFVAEDTGSSTECYQIIVAYNCADCKCDFYIGLTDDEILEDIE
jgi:hypothetical protein